MSEIKRPPSTAGLRHVAIYVSDIEACLTFYTQLLGMTIEWQPDEDNYYLTSGNDNLALHRAKEVINRKQQQVLDHLGFILKKPDDVNQWHEFFAQNNVEILSEVKDHRDGARSFYCKDPDGNVVQMIYHPPIS